MREGSIGLYMRQVRYRTRRHRAHRVLDIAQGSGAAQGEIVSVLHQDEGGIGKSIPAAQFPETQEISRGRSPREISRVEGNLERFSEAVGFAPRDPRDFPRAKPEGNPEGRGVQNPRPRKISRAEGMDFPIPPESWWSTDILSSLPGKDCSTAPMSPSGGSF